MANFKRAQEQGQIVNVNATSPLETRVVVGKKIDNGRRKDVVAPLYQSSIVAVNRGYYTISLSPAPATTAFTNNYTYQFTLLPGTVTDQVKNVRLNLQFQNTSGSQTVSMSPPNMGLMRIELYSGQNELLNTIYDTDIMIRWNFYYNRWEYEQFAGNVGLTNSWSPATTTLNLGTNAYYNFSLPLITVFDAARVHMEKIKDSILMKFYFRSLVSGGSGTLTLSGSPSLAFDCNLDGDMYRKQVDNLYDNNIVKSNYLDCMNISGSYLLTAGQTTKISLQNLNYKVPFIVFCIRSNINCTNNNMNNFQTLGTLSDTTQFNVQIDDPSGYDITNRGSGMGPSDFQLINAQMNDNNLFTSQNLYFVPFCTSLRKALIGSQESGFYYFDGSLYNLAIQPGSSFSTGTYTVDVYAYYFRCLEVSNGSLKACNY